MSLLVAVLITGAALWALTTAQRLNRLHIRTDSALAQLQSMLDRRAAVVYALEEAPVVAAQRAEGLMLRQGELERRAALERELSAHISARYDPLPRALVDAEVRIQFAHRFYNEAVADTRALRLRPAVRALRLGGTAPLPDFFEYSSLAGEA